MERVVHGDGDGISLPRAPHRHDASTNAPARVHADEALHVAVDCRSSTCARAGSAASPDSVCSSFVKEMDASSLLLIKSEELLSILDASPLVATGTMLGATDTIGPAPVPGIAEGVPALAWDALQYLSEPEAARCREESQPAQQATTVAAGCKAKKRTRRQSKDSRSDLLGQQREAVLKLEVELIMLKQQQQSSALVRDKRAQVWKELAARQLRWRQRAETENQQLKRMMEDLFLSRDPRQFEKYLERSGEIRLLSHSHGLWKGAVALSRSAECFDVFESLLQSLDARFAEIDDVFRENGMDRSLTDQRTFAQKKTRRLGKPGRYLQLVNVEPTPFPWLSVGNTVWECNKEWHCKDAPYVHPCADRPDDTFAVRYRVKSKSCKEQSADLKLVMRRYVEANRIVLVYACQSDGENELADASTTEIGYFAASSTNQLSDAALPPVSSVQICMQISPRGSGGDTAGDAKDKGLLKLKMSAFQDYVNHIRQRTDSSLLRKGHTNEVSRTTAQEALENRDARITFKHPGRKEGR